MKLQPLYDLQEEINRLYVAGSKLSAGDPRLQKQISIFNRLGEKVPVFSKIASNIDELLKADKEDSPEKLITASTLLYSVLYTQGETMDENLEIKEQIPTFDLKDIDTNTSYLEIKPVIEALTTTGSGRYEIVVDAFNSGLMKDSRLYHYIDGALGDKYSEIVHYIETKVIPVLGVSILPTLLKNFELDDSKIQERRFRCIRNLGYEKLDILADAIFKTSFVGLQVEAIEYLGTSKNEDLLISMIGEKNQTKAKAVYKGLAILGTEKALNVLVEAYLKNKSKTKVEAFTSALSLSSLPILFEEVFDKAKSAFEKLKAVDISNEAEVKNADIENFANYLDSLRRSKRLEILPFFVDILAEPKVIKLLSKKNYYNHDAPIHAILNAVDNFPDDIQIEFYTNALKQVKDKGYLRELWGRYSALSIKIGISSKDYYDRFRDAYWTDNFSQIDLINSFLKKPLGYGFHQLNSELVNSELIDHRWIELFLKQITSKWNDNNISLIYFLCAIDPSNAQLIKNLEDRIDKYKISDPNFSNLAVCLMRIGTPKIQKELNLRIQKEIIDSKTSYFRIWNMWSAIESIPKAYAEEYSKLALEHEGKPYSSLLEQIADRILSSNKN